jgi:hypothetical protein
LGLVFSILLALPRSKQVESYCSIPFHGDSELAVPPLRKGSAKDKNMFVARILRIN